MINRRMLAGMAAAAMALGAPVLASAQTPSTAPAHASAPSKPAATTPTATAAKPTAPAHTAATKTAPDNTALYKKAQEKLHEMGLYSGPIDGSHNNDYVVALKKFQTEHKLTADGRLTHATQEALKLK